MGLFGNVFSGLSAVRSRNKLVKKDLNDWITLEQQRDLLLVRLDKAHNTEDFEDIRKHFEQLKPRIEHLHKQLYALTRRDERKALNELAQAKQKFGNVTVLIQETKNIIELFDKYLALSEERFYSEKDFIKFRTVGNQIKLLNHAKKGIVILNQIQEQSTKLIPLSQSFFKAINFTAGLLLIEALRAGGPSLVDFDLPETSFSLYAAFLVRVVLLIFAAKNIAQVIFREEKEIEKQKLAAN